MVFMRKNTKYFVIVLITIIQWNFTFAKSTEKNFVANDNCCINISNQKWYYKDDFKPKYTQFSLKEVLKHNWKYIEKLPARSHHILKNKKSNEMVHFSLFTEFPKPKNISGTDPVALYLPLIGKNWAIYVNGKLIKKEIHLNEKMKIYRNRTVRFLIIPFDQNILQHEKNRLFIEIIGPYLYEFTGIPFSGVEFGKYYNIEKKHIEFYEFALITLYLFTGLYHLLLFIRRKKEKYNLYFAIFVILLFIYLFSRSTIIFNLLPKFDTDLITRIEIISLFILIPVFVLFLEDLYSKKITVIAKSYLGISLVFSLIAGIISLIHIRFVLIIWQITALLSAIYLVFITIKAIRNSIKEAKSLAIGITVLISLAVFDILDSIFMQTHLNLAKYGFFLFIIGIATILANRFLRVHNEVEFLNENLELQVEEKTKELRGTFEKVKKLKEKQDGDYYLTSLLLKPLNQNLSSSSYIDIESFTRQKKKFTFKKKKEVEIGGDIIITDTVTLKNRSYTAFLNADAMGKSIQGAGGALVIGVEFHSYLNRTKLSSVFQKKYPENWLKNIFYDLQNMFETFDGSMLASLIIGLIDNKTGFVYYINAEHPWSSLYRDGKAIFLEDRLYLHKLGIPFNRNLPVVIHTVQLKQDDILFFGSDGRDDILLGYDKDGARIVNEDETLFLRNIEKSKGNIEKLVHSIESFGELTDDLSLLKICFQKKDLEPEKNQDFSLLEIIQKLDEIYEKTFKQTDFSNRKEQYTVLKEEEFQKIWAIFQEEIKKITYDHDIFYENKAAFDIVNFFLQNNKELYAMITLEILNEVYPHLEKRIKDIIHFYQKTGWINAALLHAERLRCRIPFDLENLITLIELNYSLNYIEKAKEYANCLLSLHPTSLKEDSKIKNILNQLNIN